MNTTRSLRSWKTILLTAGGVAALLAVVPAGRGLAIGAPAAPAEVSDATDPAAGPNIVLTGDYTCTVATYRVYPAVGPTPPDEYETYVWLSHSIGIEATGALASQSRRPSVPPSVGAVGPGYAGGGYSPQLVPPVTPGMGVSGTFNDGTIEDCRRFSGAVAQAARDLGCTTSTIRRASIPAGAVNAQDTLSLSFVCEGPVSAGIHAIGELSRAVARLTVAGSN